MTDTQVRWRKADLKTFGAKIIGGASYGQASSSPHLLNCTLIGFNLVWEGCEGPWVFHNASIYQRHHKTLPIDLKGLFGLQPSLQCEPLADSQMLNFQVSVSVFHEIEIHNAVPSIDELKECNLWTMVTLKASLFASMVNSAANATMQLSMRHSIRIGQPAQVA